MRQKRFKHLFKFVIKGIFDFIQKNLFTRANLHKIWIYVEFDSFTTLYNFARITK